MRGRCFDPPDAHSYEALVGCLPPTVTTVLKTLCTESEMVQPTIPYVLSNLAVAVLARSLAFLLDRADNADCEGMQAFGLPPDATIVRKRVTMAQNRLEALSNLEGGQTALEIIRGIRRGEETWLGGLRASSTAANTPVGGLPSALSDSPLSY